MSFFVYKTHLTSPTVQAMCEKNAEQVQIATANNNDSNQISDTLSLQPKCTQFLFQL